MVENEAPLGVVVDGGAVELSRRLTVEKDGDACDLDADVALERAPSRRQAEAGRSTAPGEGHPQHLIRFEIAAGGVTGGW